VKAKWRVGGFMAAKEKPMNELLIWGARGQRGASFGDCPQLQKNMVRDQSMCSFTLSLSLSHIHTREKKKTKLWVHPWTS